MSNEPLGRRVVIAVDGSNHCHRAFNWYVKYIYRKNDFVFFAHVMQPKSSYTDIIVTVDNPESLTQLTKDFSLTYDDAAATTLKYAKLAETAGVTDFKTEILASSSVGEAVLRLATERQANIIIVGSRSGGTFRRTLLGDVSRYLATHSNIPVLMVPSANRALSFNITD
nr:universal stress protein [Hymenolepis microstoma]